MIILRVLKLGDGQTEIAIHSNVMLLLNFQTL